MNEDELEQPTVVQDSDQPKCQPNDDATSIVEHEPGGWHAMAKASLLAFRQGNPEDRYRVEGIVAQGGMGAILKAKDRNSLRYVAMKVMPPKYDG